MDKETELAAVVAAVVGSRDEHTLEEEGAPVVDVMLGLESGTHFLVLLAAVWQIGSRLVLGEPVIDRGEGCGELGANLQLGWSGGLGGWHAEPAGVNLAGALMGGEIDVAVAANLA